MTKVNLESIGHDSYYRLKAIEWLIETYGTKNWSLIGLNFIEFKNPKHATHFIMRWS